MIFGDYRSHRHVARRLGLPVPAPESGESVSARLAHRGDRHEGLPFVTLDGEHWVVALAEDPTGEAPALPDTKA